MLSASDIICPLAMYLTKSKCPFLLLWRKCRRELTVTEWNRNDTLLMTFSTDLQLMIEDWRNVESLVLRTTLCDSPPSSGLADWIE